jgi:transposase
MPPTHLAPSAPTLKSRNLTFAEREEIALECARGTGVRAIARKLGRSASTISREIRRNSATRGGDFDYRALTAQWHADRAARRPKTSKLANNPALRDYVQDRLAGRIATPEGIVFDGPVVVWKKRRAVHRQSRRWSSAWSPEQIAQRLKVDFPEDPTMRISHEAIYQALYIQGRGALKRELSACLRSGRALRLPRERARNRGKSFISDALMISERPAEIDDRTSPPAVDRAQRIRPIRFILHARPAPVSLYRCTGAGTIPASNVGPQTARVHERGDDEDRRLEGIILVHAPRPLDLFRPRVSRQARPGDFFPGLDKADRNAGTLAQHRVEDFGREIADRNGIAAGLFPCHMRSPDVT